MRYHSGCKSQHALPQWLRLRHKLYKERVRCSVVYAREQNVYVLKIKCLCFKNCFFFGNCSIFLNFFLNQEFFVFTTTFTGVPRNFSGGGQSRHFAYLLHRLLTMQCKWTLTKREKKNLDPCYHKKNDPRKSHRNGASLAAMLLFTHCIKLRYCYQQSLSRYITCQDVCVQRPMPPLSGVPACRYQQSQPRCITCQDVCVQQSHEAKRLLP